jgi:Flp pilus assembly protein TadB
MVSQLQALTISGAIAFLIYFFSLAQIFSTMRFRRHLQERWEEYGKGVKQSWAKGSGKTEDIRLRSIQVQSKLKAFLAHPYPSFKMIEFLFYRSGVFTNLKLHITFYVIGSAILMQIMYLTSLFSLAGSLFAAMGSMTLLHLFYLRSRESKWKKAFILIFPASLDIITRGLKSGLTLGRGIAVVSEEIEDPVGSEFNYMASQLQLGVSPDDCLLEAATRVGIEEFRFFALSLIIQREMGGSLAEILGKLSEVIRERERFQKKVWTLSAEGRTTAAIVGGLPVLLAIALELITPGYIKFFFVDPKGQILLWISCGLTLTGIIFITRMIKLKA